MKHRLGLDVGTNSLGWCVLQLDESDTPIKIEATGVRIFAEGRDNKTKSTLNATRREARSARRRRDRFLQRQTYLISELVKAGLFPQSEEERKRLQVLNPLELRALALTEKLPLHHIGRALFHLNQRRGFKSNRKDTSEETTSGMVSSSARKLLEQMDLIDPELDKEKYAELDKEEKRKVRQEEAEARINALEALKLNPNLTYGSFLWERQQNGLPTRARPRSDEKIYDVYPTRELLQDEFNKIWDAQSKHYPSDLTEDVRERIFNVIFYQRSLKPPPIGKCVYYPAKDRTYRAMPSFQRYRILQDVNNLEWIQGTEKLRITDFPSARNDLVDFLEKPSVKTKPSHNNAMRTFDQLGKELRNWEVMVGDCEFNLDTEKRKGLDGNQTSNVMQHEDYVGDDWHRWPVEKQDRFVSIILDDALEDDDAARKLMEEFHLSEAAAHKCLNAPLVQGTANLSLDAARDLAERMRDSCMIQSHAVEDAARSIPGFVNPYIRRRDDKLLDSLPYYGSAVKGHIIPGKYDEEDDVDEQRRTGMVPNPTVHIAMNQIRSVVNELIRRFGKPYSISIELARDLPVGKVGRRKIEIEQSENQDRNRRLDEKLEELGEKCNHTNRLKLRMWEDQDHQCVFSGTILSCSDVLSGKVEIEHLIPFSKSLDDSRSNKVICTLQANRDKGNKTPYEAFGHSPGTYRWEDIFARSRKLPHPQRWRFDDDALEKWQNDDDDFTSRHLNDTRYIGRLAKEYLENICPSNRVDVVTGRLTALLRHHWGLNSILEEVNPSLKNNDEAGKNRNDHRHHAVDAVAIAMITRPILQKVSTAANQAELENIDSLFPDSGKRGSGSIEPWDTFRSEVIESMRNLIVSHKVTRKRLSSKSTDGQLHNDTAYGLVSEPDPNGVCEVVTRSPVDWFDTKKRVECIRDEKLRNLFLKAFEEGGKDGVRNAAAERGIRRLRRTENLKVIAIKDRNGKAYKGVKGDSNWGLEIFEYPQNHSDSGKWEGKVVSRYDANNPEFQLGTTSRPHPAAKLVMRLQVNDCIECEHEGRRQLMRVQKMRQDGQLALIEIYEADVDNRVREKKIKYFLKTTGALQKLNPKKVHVSPSGIVSYQNR